MPLLAFLCCCRLSHHCDGVHFNVCSPFRVIEPLLSNVQQSCFQILLNEGDVILYRLPGGDPSDPRIEFPVESVPRVFEVRSCRVFL